MSVKPFATIDEQISTLERRGLRIPNRNVAAIFLSRVNYYRTSGYTLTMRKNDHFDSKYSFDHVVDVYTADHDLRHILFKYLETIEVMAKSIVSYEFCKVYSPLDYMNPLLFSNAAIHKKIMDKVNDQKAHSLQHELFIQHFESTGEGIPFWAIVDLFTLTDISMFYEQISDPRVRSGVSESFGLPFSSGYTTLKDSLRCLAILRNFCAHGARLYNRSFITKPRLKSDDKNLLLKDKFGNPDNAHLFGFILLMLGLLPADDHNLFMNDLSSWVAGHPLVELEHYGIPSEWIQLKQPAK